MEETQEKLTTKEKPVVDPKVEGLKVKTKKKPKKLVKKKSNEPVKVEFSSKKEENAIQEPETESSVLREEKEESTEQVELQSVGQGNEEKEESVIEEITSEEKKEVIKDISKELNEKPELDLPENVEKLVKFMKDTGGNVEDYVRLNADYSNVDAVTLLKQFYKKNKPHLDADEIEFMLDDRFSYDEEYDDEKEIRKKKLAIKEEVAKARTFLDDLKSKYYDEIKLRPGVTQEQQKATDFFNRYNQEQSVAKQRHEDFVTKTNTHFSDQFKGFEFNLGEKKFRYKVNNPSDVASKQSNIQDFVKTFLNEDGSVGDYEGYHKAIYAARNVDTIAQHFYEQGKADAVKDVVASSKNIDNKARSQSSSNDITFGGMRIKSVSGVDSSKLKIQKHKK